MKILVLGATGLVGHAVVKELNHLQNIFHINVITRRDTNPFSEKDYSKVKHYKGDLSNIESLKEAFEVDAVFCCLGTTMKTAGSKESFKAVDFHYPLKAATLLKEVSPKAHFLVVTAMGADANSHFFYNKVKGEVEEELKNLSLNRLTVLRPSLILGKRSESRFWENLGQKTATFLDPLLSKLSPDLAAVRHEKIAKAMVEEALDTSREHKFRLILSSDIKKLSA